MRVRTRTWLGFVIALGVLFMGASYFSIFDPLENVVLGVTAPVEQALQSATRPIADTVNNLTDSGRLSEENQELLSDNERLYAELAQAREAEAELERLKQFVGVQGETAPGALVAADIFARDPANARDIVAINRGSDDGLAEGMIVLTEQGSLVGSVTEVLGDHAWVTLITDPSSAVSAMVQESRVQGVVSGAADGSLRMEFVEETADIQEGNLLLTSGIGGGYPQGEPIGRIVKVERAGQELFQEVEVQPLADLSRLESLLVLTSFVPVEVSPPP
jgi:rod shape-determining protein MreC